MTFVSGLAKSLGIKLLTRDLAICLTSHENFEGSIEPYFNQHLSNHNFRYIEYDGPTIFQLDRNARKELNFTVHNGAGYETELGTLSQGFTDDICLL